MLLFRTFLIFDRLSLAMYKSNQDKDYLSAALTAGIGAGIVTTFAVAQGQHPIIALGITAIATLAAIICHQLDLI